MIKYGTEKNQRPMMEITVISSNTETAEQRCL